MSLFLKYRPQTFEDVVGQHSVVQTLKNSLKNHKTAHAYLFSGSRGTGKTSIARIFAKELIVQNITDEERKKNIYDQIQQGSFVDIIEIDGASNRGIDEIRDLREKIHFAPNIADKKIYIIDEVHMLTTPAFNALLKTLEEPPAHAYFLLATTEMHKLPDTIVSRCQCFSFQRFSLEQLIDRLTYIAKKESFSFEMEGLSLIARKAEGGMRDAVSLLDQISAESNGKITESGVLASLGISSTQTLEGLYNALWDKNQKQAFQILHSLHVSGNDMRTFGHDFLLFLRSKIHEHIDENDTLVTLIQWVQYFEKALMRLKNTPIMELPFEIAVLQIIHINTSSHAASSSTKTHVSTSSPTKPKTVSSTEETNAKPVTPPLDSTTKIEKKEVVPTPPQHKDASSTMSDHGFVFDDQNHTPQSPVSPNQEKKEVLSSSSPSEGSSTSKEFSAKTIEERMKLISEKADIPIFVRKSFLFTKPKISDQVVSFHSIQKFHIDKLNEKAVYAQEIARVIHQIFSVDIQVQFVQDNKKPQSNKPQTATLDDFSEYLQ